MSAPEVQNMQTIMIDGSIYASAQELHLALKKMLSLPDYYGMNADALNDCLGEKTEGVSLWILHPGTDEVAAALSRVSRVIEDNGGTVKEIL